MHVVELISAELFSHLRVFLIRRVLDDQDVSRIHTGRTRRAGRMDTLIYRNIIPGNLFSETRGSENMKGDFF